MNNTVFIFSDECGNYAESRSIRFKKNHPFYVRSTVIINSIDYQLFEKDIMLLKQKFDFPLNSEIKWSHLGDARNNRLPSPIENTPLTVLKKYIESFLQRASNMSSLKYIFTVTDNCTDIQIPYEKIIAWHIQNALQRAQMDLGRKGEYGVVIIDDLNDKNKSINNRCYEMMCAGDFVTYENIKKSILIDYSHQCVGLQLADIVAGVFTSALIRESRSRSGYPFASKLYTEILTKNIRCVGDTSAFIWSTPFDSVGYGLISIPKDNCREKLSIMESLMVQNEHRRLFED